VSEKTEIGASLSGPRLLAALFVGLLGALFIWIATPYADIIINTNARAADFADGYLPKGAMFVLLVLVLLVNPLLHKFRSAWALNVPQFGIIVGIVLVASVIPGDGLLRRLPYSIAGAAAKANPDRTLSDGYAELGVRPSLFPDKLGFGEPTPAGDAFINELPPRDPADPRGPKEPIPWGAWLAPAVSWGTLLVFSWMMMIGTAQIVVPQWRDNEKIPFPLLTVFKSLIEPPTEGRLLAPTMCKKSFWIATAFVFVLTGLESFSRFWPDILPVVPLSWDLSSCFADAPFRYLPWHIKSGRLLFVMLGISFFMPTRISFSIWFFILGYGFYQMLGTAFAPPFHYGTISYQQSGTALALTVSILWLGRQRWREVFGLLFRKANSPAEHYGRNAAIMFLIGCLGMVFWLVWAGVAVAWAVFYVATAFVTGLIITRMVAETGLPNIRQYFPLPEFIHMAPLAWMSAMALYFKTIIKALFAEASIASATTLGAHAIGMQENDTPRSRWRFGLLLVVVLVLGMVISGAVHLQGNYRNSVTMDGLQTPLNPYWFTKMNWALRDIDQWSNGITPGRQAFSRPLHIGIGAALAGALQVACLRIPGWPLHPIGILTIGWDVSRCWFGFFLGWAIKVLILRYGGSRLYRRAMPLFLGIIVGDVINLVFWGLLPGALVFLAPQLLQ